MRIIASIFALLIGAPHFAHSQETHDLRYLNGKGGFFRIVWQKTIFVYDKDRAEMKRRTEAVKVWENPKVVCQIDATESLVSIAPIFILGMTRPSLGRRSFKVTGATLVSDRVYKAAELSSEVKPNENERAEQFLILTDTEAKIKNEYTNLENGQSRADIIKCSRD